MLVPEHNNGVASDQTFLFALLVVRPPIYKVVREILFFNLEDAHKAARRISKLDKPSDKISLTFGSNYYYTNNCRLETYCDCAKLVDLLSFSTTRKGLRKVFGLPNCPTELLEEILKTRDLFNRELLIMGYKLLRTRLNFEHYEQHR